MMKPSAEHWNIAPFHIWIFSLQNGYRTLKLLIISMILSMHFIRVFTCNIRSEHCSIIEVVRLDKTRINHSVSLVSSLACLGEAANDITNGICLIEQSVRPVHGRLRCSPFKKVIQAVRGKSKFTSNDESLVQIKQLGQLIKGRNRTPCKYSIQLMCNHFIWIR